MIALKRELSVKLSSKLTAEILEVQYKGCRLERFRNKDYKLKANKMRSMYTHLAVLFTAATFGPQSSNAQTIDWQDLLAPLSNKLLTKSTQESPNVP